MATVLDILRLSAAIAGMATVGACAGPTSFMGIAFAPTGVSTELSDRARQAQAGDKHAQLQLGIAFEEGRGVARDLDKARAFYRMAASPSGGQIWVYTPPVGNGTSGRVMPVNAGPRIPGLEEAKWRLERLGD